jgi:hypothetical protein
LLWLNEETREQIKFIITLSTKNMNPEDRERKILVTSAGFNLVATSTRSTAPDILLTKEFLESLYQGQDLFRMWQIELHTRNGEEVPRRTPTIPQNAGKLFPTYEALKKIADAEGANSKVVLNVNDIEEGDSLHILHEYVRQLPENRHIISMVPSETTVRDSYLAKKSLDVTKKITPCSLTKSSLHCIIKTHASTESHSYSDKPHHQ